ncbi:MAG: hypothetical protein DMD96_03865 [Candidatus Rokuibacteriota bacterium]|nr:MAG: hypothetical protein DMD96_03865 [Candidatus Rokubacteria bacterium]
MSAWSSWLPAMPWRCIVCGLILVTREIAPRLWAVRLQGRDVAQFTILATVRRLLTFNMSTDIL